MAQRLNSSITQLPVEGRLPSFDGATEWLNSHPLIGEELRGRVALVQFGTYSCINWIRTLPYVRAWAQKYEEAGLAVIGVQTPEFQFEREVAGVRRALGDMDIEYPVAVDNDYAVWSAFENHYWPALYLADAQGRIRYHHFGEGNYAETELAVQQLLSEAGATGINTEVVSVVPEGVEVAADWETLESPEKYLGNQRTEGFASPGDVVADEPHVYTFPDSLRHNTWALSGDWTIGGQAARLNAPGGRIACAFHSRDLHLIMRPAVPGSPVRFQVLVDGGLPGAARGLDVDQAGGGVLREGQLYNLIREASPVTTRRFEIEFLDAGAEVYSFTFG